MGAGISLQAEWRYCQTMNLVSDVVRYQFLNEPWIYGYNSLHQNT